MLKTIFIYVIILVVAMLIFSAITDPSMKYKIKSTFSSVKGKISSNIEQIPTPTKTSCEEKAKEQIGKYMFLSSTNNFRRGSGTGENINYLYYIGPSPMSMEGTWGADNSIITYSKQIISKDGEIIGTRSYNYRPTIKLSDVILNVSLIDKKERGDIVQFSGISWEGFTKEVKNIYQTENITFIVSKQGMNGKEVVSKQSFNDNKAVIHFGAIYGYHIYSPNAIYTPEDYTFAIIPNILNNKIYEIIEYNFESCNWIDDVE